jgi:hypothetical protein
MMAKVFNANLIGNCISPEEEEEENGEEEAASSEGTCESPASSEPLIKNLKLQPVTTGSAATDMKLFGRVASLSANSQSEQDTLMRPLDDGSLVDLIVRGAKAPSRESWSLNLAEGEQLEVADSHHVTLRNAAGRAVASIVAEPARDAVGKTVPTSLSVAEHDRVSLEVEPPKGAVFPIVAGIGVQAGTFHVTAKGPESAAELRREEERVEREEEEIRQIEKEGKTPPRGPNYHGYYTTLSISRTGPPILLDNSENPTYRSHEFEFSHCNYGGIQIPTTEDKPPWGIDPERKGASPVKLAFLSTVGNCIEKAPKNKVEDAEFLRGFFQVIPRQEVWISKTNRKYLHCPPTGPHKPLLRHCYVKPVKSKTGITVGGNYRYFSKSSITTCLTVYGHINSTYPLLEEEEAIETIAGSTRSSVPEKCHWPEE